ncbi:hypothetical protein DesyoDRAFT_5165 [Desulfosporosinus youngiae DSM 17734]|uniref:Phage protein n=1 Tax=Desulfosporosinus youngiae DSM 17734 TaxID=768710 RepID=H5Y0B8_9FIRM|nr:hypothetical protein DesyoDRAFT_5165 [Desulfosporosinus youngiae DSM 17734]
MITVNLIRDSIISVLDQNFPDISIYEEELAEDFEEPCFFVKLLSASQEQLLGQRYQRFHFFDLHYYGGSNGNLHDMAEQLYDKMELISVDGRLVRGTGMRHEIVDGVLHFFVAYNFYVLRRAESDRLMQSMKQEGYVRG